MGLREKLLALGESLEKQSVEIMLGGAPVTVYASDLTGHERIEFEKFAHKQRDNLGRLTSATAVSAKLLQLGLVDEDGAKVFGPKDYAEITKKIPSDVIEQLAECIGLVAGIYKPAAPVQPYEDVEEEDEDEAALLATFDEEDPHLAGLDPKNESGVQENCLS